jgi:hypothetical protein
MRPHGQGYGGGGGGGGGYGGGYGRDGHSSGGYGGGRDAYDGGRSSPGYGGGGGGRGGGYGGRPSYGGGGGGGGDSYGRSPQPPHYGGSPGGGYNRSPRPPFAGGSPSGGPPPVPTRDPVAPRFASAADAAAGHRAALASLAPRAPTVFILRGVSGSGKSTLTAAIVGSLPAGVRHAICSADAYFVSPADGCYRFDASRLKEAHEACRRAYDAALMDRVPVVIVDNTNTEQWQYAPYVAGARSFNDAVRAGRVAGVRWATAQAQQLQQPLPPAVAAADDSDDGAAVSSSGWAPTGFRASSSYAGAAATAPPPTGAVVYGAGAAVTGAGAGGGGGGTYRIVVAELTIPDEAALRRCHARNAHGVPYESLQRQWAQLAGSHDPAAVIVPAFFPPSPPGSLAAAGGGGSRPGATAVAGPGAPYGTLSSASVPAPRGSAGGVHLRFTETGDVVAAGAAADAADSSVVPLPPGYTTVYVGLFLDGGSKRALLAAVPPRHATLYCDHVTVAHHPPPRVLTRHLLAAVGTRVPLAVTGAYADHYTQAATVAWPADVVTALQQQVAAAGGDDEVEEEEGGDGDADVAIDPLTGEYVGGDDDGDEVDGDGVGAAARGSGGVDGGSDGSPMEAEVDEPGTLQAPNGRRFSADEGDADAEIDVARMSGLSLGAGSGGGGASLTGGRPPHDDGAPQSPLSAALVVRGALVALLDSLSGGGGGSGGGCGSGGADDDDTHGAPAAAAATAAPHNSLATAGLSRNAIPHVTLSTGRGVAPANSNDMLAAALRRAHKAARKAGRRIAGGSDGRFPLLLTARLGLCVSLGGERSFLVSQRALQAFLAGGGSGYGRGGRGDGWR